MPPDMMTSGASPPRHSRAAWTAALGSKLPRVRMASAGRGSWTRRMKSQATASGPAIAGSFQATPRLDPDRGATRCQAIGEHDHDGGDGDHGEAEHRDGADVAALLEVEDQDRHDLGLRGEQ